MTGTKIYIVLVVAALLSMLLGRAGSAGLFFFSYGSLHLLSLPWWLLMPNHWGVRTGTAEFHYFIAGGIAMNAVLLFGIERFRRRSRN